MQSQQNSGRIIIPILIALLFLAQSATAQMGPGMGPGRCPMCGGSWDGRYDSGVPIPETLPKPGNENWLPRLRDVLSQEVLSREQYEADSRKFNLRMPYMRVIPDEQNHIAWIEQLFEAYGAPVQPDVPPAKETASARQAYEVARTLEQDLIPDYEWLIQYAADPDSQQVIETILFQTRMHYTMFDHALRMGDMMGRAWDAAGCAIRMLAL